MLLPPQVPQPIDSENGSPLSKLPPVAKQCAWLTITRHTGSVSPSSSARSGTARVQADRMAGALVAQDALGERRRIGEVVGAVEREHRRELLARRTDGRRRRRLRRTIRNRAARKLGPRRGPRAAAMRRADWAMNSGASLPSRNIAAASGAPRPSVSSTPPFAVSAASNASRDAACAITLFSDEQLVAWSKVFERAILAAASSTSAVSSTITATLPAPTPIAGVPLE